jgi:hypothetical protein
MNLLSRTTAVPCVAVLVLLVAALAASASAATAKACKRGQIAWRLEGRIACAPTLKAGSTHPAALLARDWVGRSAELSPRMPRKLRRAVPKIAGRARAMTLKAIAASGNMHAGRARARAAAAGPVVARQSISSPTSDLGNGSSLTASAMVKARADRSVEVDYEFAAKDRDGYTALYRPIMTGIDTKEQPVGCPTAAGVVTADESLAFGGTLIVAKRGRVLDSTTSRQALTAHARGQVGADARLHHFDSDVTLKMAGYNRGSQVETTIRATLSAPREGAATVSGTPAVTVRVRLAGASAKEERAAERQSARDLAADPNLRASMAGLGESVRGRLLRNEHVWYDLPNDCARIQWTPEPIAQLDPDTTRQVEGRVVTSGGQESAGGEFTITRVNRGRFSAVRAASAPGAPALFSAAAGEPDGWKQTVSADLIATSTAGRAERGWAASGERAQFPWRIGGTLSSSQHAPGWESTFAGTVSYDLQDVTPHPDGSATATYDMSAYELPMVFNHVGLDCAYEGTGSGSGWTWGTVEITRAKDGTVTYTLLFDAQVEGIRFRYVDCSPPVPDDFSGAAPAYLKAAPRAAEPGMRLHAVGATDMTSHNADTVTASWDITPCPEPAAGPQTVGCSG